MSTIVIIPGGFHPFHAGHYALYKSAVEAFPNAEVYVAATNDTTTRPFPFSIKEKLAKVAGVATGHFIQVKSPFQPNEITSKYNPETDVLIFVRSEKDKTQQPLPGGTKKDGTPSYLQPYNADNLQSFNKHAYIAYLPTVEFGPGITSATEIRNAWPNLNDNRKAAMVMSLYPAAQKNPKLTANIVKMLDMAMAGETVEEGQTADMRAFFAGTDAGKTPAVARTSSPITLNDIQMILQKYRKFGAGSVTKAEYEKLKLYKLGKELYNEQIIVSTIIEDYLAEN